MTSYSRIFDEEQDDNHVDIFFISKNVKKNIYEAFKIRIIGQIV